MRDGRSSLGLLVCSLILSAATAGCAAGASSEEYFGKVVPPEGQVMRYVSGGEPESMDPQLGTSQPEARIYVALFDGLTDYDPKTAEAIPGLAERWEPRDGNTTFLFYLRDGLKWSDGVPITASDFVYTVRRGLTPTFASRNAYMAYDILYAKAFNEGAAFARNVRTGEFVADPDEPSRRLTVPLDQGEREKVLTPALRAALAGTTLVPVKPEDLGVEALDERTIRIRTMQPVPYLPGLLAHQFFRPVPKQSAEKYGSAWTRPGNIVSSGAFLLQTWRPYDRMILVPNPNYWDAKTVRLDRLTFYTLDDQTTMLNLYKAGEVDAVYNHTVPVAWYDSVSRLKDYVNAPEVTIEYYQFNVTRPPMDNRLVRRAFNMAIDKVALAHFKRTAKPLTGFMPEGIFPGYPYPRGDEFDVATAKKLLVEAGYKDGAGNYAPSSFPVSEVELTYNTSENNRQIAEFVQAQWRQNLGITVPLRNMEFRTFLEYRAGLQYRGVARAGWVGDYLDPFTFLDLFSTPVGNNGSGWFRPEYAQMLRNANREADPDKRYAMLAKAESYLLAEQPVIPLLTNSTNYVRKPYVKGMYGNPVTIHPWKHVYIEHDPARW
jgi:ABC-type oligopeptide transport system substrate-binding subunit